MSEALVNLREVRRALFETRGKRKLDLILSAPDPEALVAALPAEELYFAILDIGADDAAELVALSTPEQFRHFIDMSAWPRSDEGPRTVEVIRWLTLAREGGEEDANVARFRKQLAQLDSELVSLLLRREITVHELTEDNQPDPTNPGMAFYTPDRRYLLDFTGGAGYAAVKQIVDDLYAEDPFIASRLMESLRWDVPTELEETARRWRDARLRDLGVPPFEEAIEFYARSAPARPGGAGPVATTALTAPTRPVLDVALEQLSGEELERAEESLVYASNAALVANRVALGDPDEVRDALTAARATLSLGLEVLSAGDPVQAARVLVEEPIRAVFQAGLADGYRLQTRARKVAAAARLPEAKSITVLDAPLDAVVEGLLRARPALHEPGARRPRPFASRADVLRAESLLDEADATVSLLGKLALSPAELAPHAAAAQLAPSAVKGSAAVRALAESQLQGGLISSHLVSDQDRPLSDEAARKVDDLLSSAAATDAERRAAEHLRKALRK